MRITSRTRWLLLAEMLGLTIVLIAAAVLLRPAGSHVDSGVLLYGVAQVVVLARRRRVHELWWLMRTWPRRVAG